MKKKIAVCTTSKNCLTWNEISQHLNELKNNLEKVDYLKNVGDKPEFLRKVIRKKVFNELGRLYIELRLEKEAEKAFIIAENKELAKECYQTRSFFKKKDEKLLNQKLEELRRLNNEKSI